MPLEIAAPDVSRRGIARLKNRRRRTPCPGIDVAGAGQCSDALTAIRLGCDGRTAFRVLSMGGRDSPRGQWGQMGRRREAGAARLLAAALRSSRRRDRRALPRSVQARPPCACTIFRSALGG